jgi:exopolyphosphatase/guanosine-5'-triphosphate,3'-diphosphate pyrophosphatase
MESPLAVIDLGSNSARVVVLQVSSEGQLEILADARSSLQLARHVDNKGKLVNGALTGAVDAVRDFQAVALAAGARRTVAVATAAIRNATNRDQVVDRIHTATGLTLRVIEGDDEARYAFLGAIHGLPVDSGMLMDVGGGSLELAYFVDRRPLRWWTLPLGALLATDRFLRNDPPRPSEIAELRDHVVRSLHSAAVPELDEGSGMVGTGGTVRNLAKVHLRSVAHPIARVDNYVMQRRDVREVATRLLSRNLPRRRAMAGLSTDRADSITGGAVVVMTTLETAGARALVVSGHGLREGVALAELGLPLPDTGEIRRSSVAALAAHFSSWDAPRAQRRLGLVRSILTAADPAASAETVEITDHAAMLADIGRSVNYYDRWVHAANVVAAADLRGFSHREIALIATTLARVGKGGGGTMPRYARLLTREDVRTADRLAVVLELAHELELRLPPEEVPVVRSEDRRGRISVTTSLAFAWAPGDLVRRFRGRFGRPLAFRATEAPMRKTKPR